MQYKPAMIALVEKELLPDPDEIVHALSLQRHARKNSCMHKDAATAQIGCSEVFEEVQMRGWHLLTRLAMDFRDRSVLGHVDAI